MHKYFNSLTIHFYLSILTAFITILIIDNISLSITCLLVFALPIWLTFYNRVCIDITQVYVKEEFNNLVNNKGLTKQQALDNLEKKGLTKTYLDIYTYITE